MQGKQRKTYIETLKKEGKSIHATTKANKEKCT